MTDVPITVYENLAPPPLSDKDVARIADAVISKLKAERFIQEYFHGPNPKQWFPAPGFTPSYPYPNNPWNNPMFQISNTYGEH